MRAPKSQWRPQTLTYQAAKELPVSWHISYGYETPKTGRQVLGVSTPAEHEQLTLPLHTGVTSLVERMYHTYAATLLAMLETFGVDKPWPDAVSHPWKCSFCGFRPTCPWWDVGTPDFGDSVPF